MYLYPDKVEEPPERKEFASDGHASFHGYGNVVSGAKRNKKSAFGEVHEFHGICGTLCFRCRLDSLKINEVGFEVGIDIGIDIDGG